jgi:hypothetical protein
MPFTTKENEDLLPIIYSMMLFTKEEINSLQKTRQEVMEKALNQKTKAGLMGMFGGKKPAK